MSRTARLSRVPKTSTGAVTLPDMLAYQRSFQASDGRLYGVRGWDGEDPAVILPQERSARGANAPDAAILEPELVATEGKSSDKQNQAFRPNTIFGYHHAVLPPGRDVLEMRWSLHVFPGALEPAMSDESSACYRIAGEDEGLTASEILRRLVRGLSEAERADLAARYLWRIIDGSVLWRNRVGNPCRTVLLPEGGSPVVVDPGLRVLSSFPGLEVLRGWAGADADALTVLHRRLAEALFSPDAFLRIEIRTRVQMGLNHEVWPSQLLEQEKSGPQGGGRPKRYLLVEADEEVGGRTAGLTFQKIANRIRRIDEWHGVPDLGAICVEHYGYEMSAGIVYRKETNNIYAVLRRLLAGGVLSPEERLYVIAMLIRGGTFVQKGEDKKTRDKKLGKDAVPDDALAEGAEDEAEEEKIEADENAGEEAA